MLEGIENLNYMGRSSHTVGCERCPNCRPLCFSAEHYSFFGMPSAELLITHEEENVQKEVV
jgi:hypothetical protein